MQDDGGAFPYPVRQDAAQQRIDPQLRIAVEAAFDRQHIRAVIRSGAQAQ